jgi:hypothetical protein
MTYDEFLEALKQTPREWQLIGVLKHIRLEMLSGYEVKFGCPITALLNRHSREWESSGEALGLDRKTVERIIQGADCAIARCEAHAQDRQDLLLACGLWPEETT